MNSDTRCSLLKSQAIANMFHAFDDQVYAHTPITSRRKAVLADRYLTYSLFRQAEVIRDRLERVAALVAARNFCIPAGFFLHGHCPGRKGRGMGSPGKFEESSNAQQQGPRRCGRKSGRISFRRGRTRTLARGPALKRGTYGTHNATGEHGYAAAEAALAASRAFFLSRSDSIRSMALTSARSVVERGFQSDFSMPIKVVIGRSAVSASLVFVTTDDATNACTRLICKVI